MLQHPLIFREFRRKTGGDWFVLRSCQISHVALYDCFVFSYYSYGAQSYSASVKSVRDRFVDFLQQLLFFNKHEKKFTRDWLHHSPCCEKKNCLQSFLFTNLHIFSFLQVSPNETHENATEMQCSKWVFDESEYTTAVSDVSNNSEDMASALFWLSIYTIQRKS